MTASTEVETWLAAQDEVKRAGIDALRHLVRESADGLTEHIKWNAPSFMAGGDDRITLGLRPKGGFRVVLHRGAKSRTPEGFAFADPDGLAAWPAPDRGVIEFNDLTAITAKSAPFRDLVRRWIEATG